MSQRGTAAMTHGTTPPRITLRSGIDLCQSDLPLDWYQDEFRPYAQEYLEPPGRALHDPPSPKRRASSQTAPEELTRE